MIPAEFAVLIRFLMAVVVSLLLPAESNAAKYDVASQTFPKAELQGVSQVHPVDISGDEQKELVLVSKDSVAVFETGEKGYQLRQRVAIPKLSKTNGRTYYAFARFQPKGKRQIVLLSPEGIMVYPVAGDRIVEPPITILKKQLIQGQTSGASPQFFDFALDLDSDGLDDFLVPEANGFSIYRQTAPMKFEAAALPKNPYERRNSFYLGQDISDDPQRVKTLSAAFSYRKGVENLLLFDADNDGRQDLIYSSTHHGKAGQEIERFEVFLQKKQMIFGSEPDQVMEMPYENNADVTFRDLNGDKRLDAIVAKSNVDIVNPRTVVKFYIAKDRQYSLFDKESDRFVTKDPMGLVAVNDFNGDKATDFAMTFFSYQFGSAEDIVDMAVSGKVSFKLQFYLGHGSTGYSRTPASEQEITINFKDSPMRGAPVQMIPDLNGDGIMDLVVRRGDDILDVYASTGDLKFPQDPSRKIEIPEQGGFTVDDVNSDGLADIIVYSAPKQQLSIHFSTVK